MQPDKRSRPAQRNLHLFEIVVVTAFIAIIGFCAYDGFKEIFTSPQPFKPKQAEESLRELKAQIAQSKTLVDHKYIKQGRGERRSALANELNTTVSEIYEPIYEDIEPLSREEPHAYTKVVVLSAMQESPCITDGGDQLHYQSVKNKQDYARIHGYEFVLGVKQVDPGLENMWNKPAWLNKVLEDEELQAEWVLWVDIDTVILDLNFTLAFDEYAAKSKDLVVYGNVTQVQAGHPVEALNTGVMLVHNTPWSRKFFAEVARLGRLDDHHMGKNTLSKILLKELQSEPYSDGLRDQNAVIYLLKVHSEWQSRVAFLDKEICLNCYWRDLIGVTGFGKADWERQEEVSFIQHFMGCQICNALNRNGDLEQCQSGMSHSFNYLTTNHSSLLSDLGPRSEAQLAQLRQLPYCSSNPGLRDCIGAKPLDDNQRAKAQGAKDSVGKFDWKTIDGAVVDSTLTTLKLDQQEASRSRQSNTGSLESRSLSSGQDQFGKGEIVEPKVKDLIRSTEQLREESPRLLANKTTLAFETNPRRSKRRPKKFKRLSTSGSDDHIVRRSMTDRFHE